MWSGRLSAPLLASLTLRLDALQVGTSPQIENKMTEHDRT
jgi:hypothetical protein